MDPSNVITQVSREEEQLSTFPPPATVATKASKKPRRGGFLYSLFCCWRKGRQGGGHTSPPSLSQHAEGDQDGDGVNKLSLLPPLRPADQGKICLVIDLDETLVHSSFKPVSNPDFVVPVEIEGSVHQVYVLKRPYVDEFLEHVGKLYECVLFTASLSKYADPVADLLDKWGVFRGRLFRESCAFYRGNYVKDLNRLGRDIHKVVIIDNSPASYMFHPDNAVPVVSWFDDMNDTELRDLLPFFDKLASANDVYSMLRQNHLQQQQMAQRPNGATTPPPPPAGHNNYPS